MQDIATQLYINIYYYMMSGNSTMKKLGQGILYLSPLQYLLDVGDDHLPLINTQGQEVGKVGVKIVVDNVDGKAYAHRSQEEVKDGEEWTGEELVNHIGKTVTFKVSVDGIKGLASSIDTNSAHIQFQFDIQQQGGASAPVLKAAVSGNEAGVSPTLNFQQEFKSVCSKELQSWFATESIRFELWGKLKQVDCGSVDGANLTPEQLQKIKALEQERDQLKQQLEKQNKSKFCIIS